MLDSFYKFLVNTNSELLMYTILLIFFFVESLIYPVCRLKKESLAEFGSNIVLIALHNLGKYIFLPQLIIIYKILFDYRVFDISWTMWGLFLTVILIDLIYYIYHRCMHKFSVLWAVHSVHHQPRFVNLSMAARLSFFNKALTYWFYLPLALIGVPISLLFVAGIIDAFFQALTHSRSFQLPKFFRKIFIDSRDHHLHHGSTTSLYNLNFGGMFSIWDYMLGTHSTKELSEKMDTAFDAGTIEYGIQGQDGDPRIVNNPILANLHPFLKLFVNKSN